MTLDKGVSYLERKGQNNISIEVCPRWFLLGLERNLKR